MLLRPEAALADDRYDFVRQYLARNPAPSGGGVLFDIGAGTRPMKASVEAAGYEWHGFDLAPKSPDVTQWNINTPFVGDRRADIILLMDVIEHTYNPGMAMLHLSKVLKPEGRLVMTMPNPRWSRARTMHLYSGFIACFTQHDLDANHHVFTPWPHIVLNLVLESGLAVKEYVTLDRDEIKLKGVGPVFPIRAIESLVRKVIESRDPAARGMSYAFVVGPRTADTKQ